MIIIHVAAWIEVAMLLPVIWAACVAVFSQHLSVPDPAPSLLVATPERVETVATTVPFRPHPRPSGRLCIPRSSLLPGPICPRPCTLLWHRVGWARMLSQLEDRPWHAGHNIFCGTTQASAYIGHCCHTQTTPQAPLGCACVLDWVFFPGLAGPDIKPSCDVEWAGPVCSPRSDWGEWQGSSHQCKALSILNIGKPVPLHSSLVASKLLQPFCLTQLFSQKPKGLSPSCRTPGLGGPVCGLTHLLPRARIHPCGPSLPFRFLPG